jgi:UDP-N-acetylmuramoylalanine--D-glutamate ligase
VSTTLVVGLARSGRAAVRALLARGDRVVAYDRDAGVAVEDERALGARVELGGWHDGLLDGVDLLVKSPGVPSESPPVQAAREHGVDVISEIELGVRLLRNPILGVTGTNGKTTTTALLGAILAEAGLPVEVAGNIGRPLASLVGAVAEDAWIVCELSSFQLEDVETLRPRVAVLLNLEPDHLDRHGTFDAYRDAKLRIFENQEPGDVAVVPRGFGAIPGSACRVEFAWDDPLPAEPRIPGPHNRENAAAATAAARALGLEGDAVGRALRSFQGVAHRIEEIATVGGVRYVNDSKATNVAASLRALASFPDADLHVILGGRGKKESYDPLAAAFKPGDRAYLIGEAAEEIAPALAAHGIRYELSRDLESAFFAARGAATRGAVVLLSPACASFDQFDDFEHRGEEFRRLVAKLAG